MFPSDKLLEISMKSYADERSVIKEMISNLNIDPQLKEISVISNELAMLIKNQSLL